MNTKSLREKRKPYIPDSSKAEEWLTEDIFIYSGRKYRVLPDGNIVKIRKNGKV